MKSTSRFLSILLHPIFFFTYIFVVLFYFSDTFIPYKHTYNLWLVLLYVVINSVLIPSILVFFISRDLELKDSKQRKKPLLLVSFLYLVIYFFFQRFLFPEFLLKYLLGLVIGMAIIGLSSNRINFSLHTAGAGSLIALFLSLLFYDSMYFPYFMATILLAGISGSARLYLEAHSIKEIVGGYVIGFSATMLLLLF